MILLKRYDQPVPLAMLRQPSIQYVPNCLQKRIIGGLKAAGRSTGGPVLASFQAPANVP